MYFKLFNKSILKIDLETLFIEAAFIYILNVFLHLIIETLLGNFYELVRVLWPLSQYGINGMNTCTKI